MEKYDEVNGQLLIWGRLSGLKVIYSDEKESRVIQILANFLYFHLVFTLTDILYCSLQFFSKEDLIKLVVNFLNIWLGIAGLGIYLGMRNAMNDYAKKTAELKQLHHTPIPCLKEIYDKHFTAGYKNCHFLNRLIGYMAIFAEISFLTFGTGFSYFSTKSSYPWPFFREICFCPITGPVTYVINLIAVGLCCGTIICYFVMNGTHLFYVLTLVGAKLDVTIEIVNEIATISDELSYDDWIKAVIDSISVSKDVLFFLRQKNLISCYLLHKTSYVSLFVSFVIFQIDPRQMGTACAGFMIVLDLLIWVLLNEQVQDKFSDLNEAIYNVNWYDMKPKDRKPLIILISTSQRSVSLSAGGIDDLTLEWFGGLLQASYSAALILQDLVA